MNFVEVQYTIKIKSVYKIIDMKIKNLRIIKAAPLISKEISPMKIIIAEEGNFTEYKKLIDSISISHFEGDFEVHNNIIPNEMVAELFEKAELLILPYIKATQSGPPSHSLCLEKNRSCYNGWSPSRSGCAHGKTGLIVPPKNVDALAEAIIY